MKAWREKNAAKVKAYQAAYDNENREARREACKNWYRRRSPEVKQKRLQASAEYRRKHPEKVAILMRKAYERDRQKYKDYSAKWRKENPEFSRQQCHMRRAIKLHATVGDTRIIALWNSRWKKCETVRCYWCMGNFKPSDCAMDHIISLTLKGYHSIENLCISCRICNSIKCNQTLQEWNSKLASPTFSF